MDDGQGFEALYPSLKTDRVLGLINDIPCIIRMGSQDSSSLIKMLPMPELSAVEITNVINYISQDLNKSDQQMQLQEVQRLLSECTAAN